MEIYTAFQIAVEVCKFTWLGAIVCAIIAWQTKRTLLRGMCCLLTLVLLLPTGYMIYASGIFDQRFRTYKQLYRDIHCGMTREEVMETIKKRYPEGGKRKPPIIITDSDSRIGMFMASEGSDEPNCEGIFIQMQNNKVVNKKYSPD